MSVFGGQPVAWAGCAAILAQVAGPAGAAEASIRLDIPAGDAAVALREFARQTGLQILFPYEMAVGRRTPGLTGRFTALEAAERLAGPLGLVVRSADGRTVTLGPAVADPVRPGSKGRERPATEPAVASAVATARDPAPISAPAAPPGLLQEVVVTATRQPELLSRVPISMTAATARNLEQEGVRQASDLQVSIPSLVLSQLTPSLANVAIRGVTDTGSGAATAGFYLDDTPLQKRNAGGVRTGSGNGTPLPPLFDVERVEVLRGPQGTLFGAGSEGGTVRYITAQPDLSRPTVYVRSSVSATAGGAPSGELGVAVGAPLIADRLAVRVTAYQRDTGGFLDYLDPNTGQVRWPDANKGRARLLRAVAALVPATDWKLTASFYSSSDHWDSAVSTYTPSMRDPIVAPTQCFDTAALTPATPQNNPSPVPCDSPGVTYRRPGLSYGPYPDLGPGRTLLRDRNPTTTTILAPSLTLDYAGKGFTARAISSYTNDRTRFTGLDNLSQVRDSFSNASYGPIFIPKGFTLAGDFPDAWRSGHFYSRNRRRGLTEELRLASLPEARPISWVAGLFYSNLKTWQNYDNVYESLDLLARTLYGISAAQRYGVGPYPIDGVPSGFDHKDQTFKDMQIAAFGEADYWISDRLKLILGLRISSLTFDYVEHHYGPASGFNVPTQANGGGPNTGAIHETPVAPKFGLQYLLSDRDMVYLTAAEGFRAGGVNANLPMAICGPGLAQYGMTSADVPRTYRSDSVWSYEAGGKFRLAGDRLQLNAAAYRIDWKDAQLTVDVGNNCGIPFISNAGAARSQGLELEAQAEPAAGLTVDVGLSYDDVRYAEDAVASSRGATPLVVAIKGQQLTIPPWTLHLGGRYDVQLAGLPVYMRGDWYYTRAYDAAAPQTYGLPAYAPDAVMQNAGRLNLRLGVEHNGLDASLFVTNLLNSAAGSITGGRSGCALPGAGGTAACTTYATYNPFLTGTPATAPRQIGLQLVYRR